jgi:type IV pilus assembly protein PilW
MLKSVRSQRGLSIVEMMVGVAIGLVIVAAATMMTAAQLADNRRLLLETQVQQDLRATADVITRDLRRAGYWKDSHLGTVAGAAASAPMANPYSAVLPAVPGVIAHEVTYTYAARNAPEDNAVTSAEQLGFRLSGSVIETQLGGGNWQALTDGATLKVTAFNITEQKQDVTLACFRACSAGATTCPPVLSVRDYTIDIAGEAVTDPAVARSIRTQVRLRNDLIDGECRD